MKTNEAYCYESGKKKKKKMQRQKIIKVISLFECNSIFFAFFRQDVFFFYFHTRHRALLMSVSLAFLSQFS